MELYISEKIYKYRKDRDMTQEELAAALDVSPQAVSNWERGGYPDITMLPAIANFFGVTIDELMGNDLIGQEKDKENFGQNYRLLKTDDEKLELARTYHRKYPDDPYFMHCVSSIIRNIIIDDTSKREKLMPLMNEVCEKMLDIPKYREYAILDMAVVCAEDQLDHWLSLSTESPMYTTRSILKYRYEWTDDAKNADIQRSLEAVEQFSTLIDARYRDALGPERKAEYHRNILAIMDALRVDGKLPDGWLLLYGYKSLVLAACLFGCGKADEGWRAFEVGMDMMKTWFGFPKDAVLDLGGGELFGGLKIKKNWYYAVTPDGEEHELLHNIGIFFYTPERLYSFLTNPRWAWFNSARSDERFVAAVDWAKALADKDKAE